MAIDPRRIEVIDDASAEVMRRMSPAQKWEMTNRMYIQAREMLMCHLRGEHPEWTEGELREQVNRRVGHGTA